MSDQGTEQARLYVGREMADREIHPVCGGTAAVFSTRSPGKETANEDAAAIIPVPPDAAILAVADGLGGGPSGQHASSLAVQSLEESVRHPQFA